MGLLVINGMNFELTDSSLKLLSSYLKRLKNYTKEKSIDNDIYNDLESRLCEKLSAAKSANGEISDSDVMKIINDLGEIDEIFTSDQEKSMDSPQTNPFLEKLKKVLKGKVYRNSTNGIIFGVCEGLGDIFEIDPVWIRLLFVVLTIIGLGSMIIIYLILAIIMPNKQF
ncbi:MAG: PspC domain-containing protein [Candidatus Absconditabacteria bacterium]